MKRTAIRIVVVLCVVGFIGSLVVRGGQAQKNCDNVATLRDAMRNIIILADELSPPSDKADKFYADALAELRKVDC